MYGKIGLGWFFFGFWLRGFFLLREGSISAQGIHTALDILFCSDSLYAAMNARKLLSPTFFSPLSKCVCVF